MVPITSGTPCPRASGVKLLTRKVTTIAPITGTRMTKAPHGLGGAASAAMSFASRRADRDPIGLA
jgi:hypothetical protein